MKLQADTERFIKPFSHDAITKKREAVLYGFTLFHLLIILLQLCFQIVLNLFQAVQQQQLDNK